MELNTKKIKADFKKALKKNVSSRQLLNQVTFKSIADFVAPSVEEDGVGVELIVFAAERG